MYKDKDKQREANRKAQAKFKAKGITKQGITTQRQAQVGYSSPTSADIPTQTVSKLKRGKDIKYQHLIRPVQLDDRVLLLGTEKGIEPPLSVKR